MAILSETSKVRPNSREEKVLKLLNDASTDETTSDAVDSRNVEEATLLVEAGAGVSSGVVKLEGAVSSDYSGTWVELGSLTINAANQAFATSIATSLAATDVAGLPIPYVRARIETVIGGGTIDVYLILQY